MSFKVGIANKVIKAKKMEVAPVHHQVQHRKAVNLQNINKNKVQSLSKNNNHQKIEYLIN